MVESVVATVFFKDAPGGHSCVGKHSVECNKIASLMVIINGQPTGFFCCELPECKITASNLAIKKAHELANA